MNLKIEQTKREEGFTLIELLVVVIIIGILAAIAIPIFLNQRAQAWERTASSDARNAAIALESYMNDEFEYPDAAQLADLNATPPTAVTLDNDEVITPSPQVSMIYDVNAAGDQFIVCAEHANLDPAGGPYVALYHSGEGGLSQEYDRNDGATATECSF